MIDTIEPYEPEPDYHAVVTIQLCELVEDGFCDRQLTDWEWPSYSVEQDTRLREKLVDHYWFREISLVPPRTEWLASLMLSTMRLSCICMVCRA